MQLIRHKYFAALSRQALTGHRRAHEFLSGITLAFSACKYFGNSVRHAAHMSEENFSGIYTSSRHSHSASKLLASVCGGAHNIQEREWPTHCTLRDISGRTRIAEQMRVLQQ
jgi:hypothetical protein